MRVQINVTFDVADGVLVLIRKRSQLLAYELLYNAVPERPVTRITNGNRLAACHSSGDGATHRRHFVRKKSGKASTAATVRAAPMVFLAAVRPCRCERIAVEFGRQRGQQLDLQRDVLRVPVEHIKSIRVHANIRFVS